MLDIAAMRATLSPPHRAGHPFILGCLAVALAGLIFWSALVWLGVLGALFCAFFFRDPDRVTPTALGLVVAPADGRIVSVAQHAPPPELGMAPAPVWRVAIFLSVLDVHINRFPVDGKVARIAYRPGKFLSAGDPTAGEANERNSLVIELEGGQEAGQQIAVVQIAGQIARRIVCFAHERETARAGARFGLIRFGSRVDLYLPPGIAPRVVEGQRTVGGETVIADLLAPEAPPAQGEVR
jgi:phosphatidylserine decarboxylase